jgi:trk system potassium uptake protein TrkA
MRHDSTTIMNILILGAGEIGFYMAQQLSSQEHNICIIDTDESVAAEVNEKLDARVVEGNGSSVTTLEEAGVADCDVFLGLSSSDNTNLVSASLAKSLGAKRAIARVHSDVQKDQWMFDFRAHFNIDYLFSSERLAAVELAKYIRNPDCLIVEEVARGRIEIQQMPIYSKSSAIGKSLIGLNLPPRVRVGAIQRAGHAIVPNGAEVLCSEDVVTLFGNPRTLQEVAPIFRGPSSSEIRVVIFGGGEYGIALAQMLDGGRFRTRIIEKDAKRCAYLASVLQRTTVIHGDATSLRQLKEEQVGEADFFVGATIDDEDNVMTCLQAKDLGVKHCVTLIHRADYADAITRAGSKLGIVGAVSPRVATSKDLMRFVTDQEFSTLIHLEGGVDVIEFILTEESPMAGKSICDVTWPKGSGLVSLTHGSQAIVPTGMDVLHVGDSVVAMVSIDSLRDFRKLIR